MPPAVPKHGRFRLWPSRPGTTVHSGLTHRNYASVDELIFEDVIMMRGLVFLSVAVAAMASTSSAFANGASGEVVAESRFGHGTVSGPVRAARHGREVRLPGGTWIDCGRSCAETLRTETVDFWENKGAGPNSRIDNTPGLFGRLGRSF
jgi:hypothetical protein